jgi:fatty-acyl-CoA synthase
METVHRQRGSVSFAPNFAFARLTKRATDADLARWDLSCVRALGCGAEPIHPGTMRAFLDRFAVAQLRPEALLPCYGMAEATLAMSFVGLDEPLRIDTIDRAACQQQNLAQPLGEEAAADAGPPLEIVCCGRPFVGHELGIFAESGEPLPDRHIGEIRFRGPSVAAGYFRNPEATAQSFTPAARGGWLHTGDLGYMVDGELYISGRKKDVLILNGRNYYPQGIEWLVESVAGIRRGNVVTFSVPGEASEEAVVVAETPESDPNRRQEIRAAVRSLVNAELGLPVADVYLLGPGELPKTTSGKLQRQRTRSQYLAGTLGGEGVRSLGSSGQQLTVARHLAKSFVSRVRHQAGAALGLRRADKRDAEAE